MRNRYDFSKLTPDAFEVLVNQIALTTLGAGLSTLGPGADAGRDGYFEGKAPYPSSVENWSGTWYIQSKFHAPNASSDAQKWLLKKIKDELADFQTPRKRRKWPDIWILATNVEPSGAAEKGTFDAARNLIERARPELAGKFHIWGAGKIAHLLDAQKSTQDLFRHFITTGHVLSALIDQLSSEYSDINEIIRCFVYADLAEQQFTKLEQAGADSSTRPGIHNLFIDLPFRFKEYDYPIDIVRTLTKASTLCLKAVSNEHVNKRWSDWNKDPSRCRLMFIKGGPGQGKSTLSQFFAQIQRASLILDDKNGKSNASVLRLSQEIKSSAIKQEIWPQIPRIPIIVELRKYAFWLSQCNDSESTGVLSYLAHSLTKRIESKVTPRILKKCIAQQKWFISFDGLDEVPSDLKDSVALEILRFFHDTIPGIDGDVLGVCTSRPQGYSDQFKDIEGAEIELARLPIDKALKCASSVLQVDQSSEGFATCYEKLESASRSLSVRELMTTPLQSHIMAIIVKDGGRPPDRKWNLYRTFYTVIKRRETNRDLPNVALANLLSEYDQLIKAVHNRLGFVLHSRAEKSSGASTDLRRSEFEQLIGHVVKQLTEDDETKDIERTLSEATRERLVLVSTPDSGESIRFDIRPLQEFFAAEFLYESVGANDIEERVKVLAGDTHWREVTHFLLSALVESQRHTEIDVAIQALQSIDESQGGNREERTYHQRSAKGLLVVIRLLTEGVLEQDKRIRDKFRTIFKQVSNFYDIGEISELLTINHINSQKWAIDVLFDAIYQYDIRESYAALAILATLVDEVHPRKVELEAFYRSLPIENLDNICRLLNDAQYFHSQKFSRQDWFVNLTIETYAIRNWKELNVERSRWLLNLVGQISNQSPEVTKNIIITPKIAKLLDCFLASHGEIISEKKIKSLGAVDAMGSTVSWFSGKLDKPKWWDSVAFSSVEGIFRIAFLFFEYATSKRYDVYAEIFDALESDRRKILELSGPFVRLILPDQPTQKPRSQNAPEMLSEDEHEELVGLHVLNGEKVEEPISYFEISSKCTKKQWLNILGDHPQVALEIFLEQDQLWNSQVGPKKPKILSRKDCREAFLEELRVNPERFKLQYANACKLFKHVNKEDIKLKSVYYKSATETPPFRGGSIVEAFPLDLAEPDDYPLLPKIAASLLSVSSSLRLRRQVSDRQIENIVDRFFEKCPRFLGNAAESEDHDIAFSALVLQQASSKERRTKNLLLAIKDKCRLDMEGWKWNSLLMVCKLEGRERDEEWREFLGELFAIARESLPLRSQLHRVIAIWKEESQFPVTSGAFYDEWLSQ